MLHTKECTYEENCDMIKISKITDLQYNILNNLYKKYIEELLEYKISTCCQPISGDNVFGFITIQDGIKIHAISCPNAIRLRTNFSYRIVSCKWKNVKNSSSSDFKSPFFLA